jgi:hypothetical protein
MEDPRRTALSLIEQDDWYLHELWLRYWANGGQAQQFEFDAYLHGIYELDPFDLRILTWVLEEISA